MHELKQFLIDVAEKLPGVVMIDYHGQHLKFAIKDRGFAWWMEDHPGNGRLEFNARAQRGVQESMIEANPKLYYYPDYVGHKGWVGAWMDVDGVERDVIEDLLIEAWKMSAPKRVVAEWLTKNQ